MAQAITWGKGDNRKKWASAFGGIDWLNNLRLRNLDHAPFKGKWDDAKLFRMALFLARLRVKRQMITERYAITTLAIAETLWPNLPADLHLGKDAAEYELLMDIASIFPVSICGLTRVIRNYPDVIKKDAVLDLANNKGLPEDINKSAGKDLTLDIALKFVGWASTINENENVEVELIVTSTIAAAKQGNLSTAFVSKIIRGIELDTGKQLSLETEVIQEIWNRLGKYFDEDVARDAFKRWENQLPDNALRMKLTMNQTIGEGLTTFSTIVKALRLFPDFSWTTVETIIPMDWANFSNAVAAVGDDAYYGYRADIGPARSTLFKSLGYVAKELLVKLAGEAALGRYAGWTRRPVMGNALDQLIVDYEQARSNAATQVGRTPLGTEDPLVRLVADIDWVM